MNQSARPSRQKKDDQNQRQQGRACLSRLITLHLDQVHREKEKRSTQRAVEKKSQQVRAGEGPVAEKIERQHWVTSTRFENDERAQTNGRYDEGSDHRWVREGEARRLDQAEYECAETDCGETCAAEIETTARVAHAFRNMAKRDTDNNNRHRNIDEEDGAPGNVIDQPAAKDRPDRSGNGTKSRPSANCAAAIFLRKRAAYNGEAARNQERGSESLHGAGEDELPNRPGESAPGRSRGKDRHTDQEDAAPSVMI